jgi:hypothetical protein
MEYQWNGNDRKQMKLKKSNRSLSEFHFSHHKFRTDCCWIKPESPDCEVGDKPPEPWQGHHVEKLPK